jgi:hypothetical protein
MACQAPEGLVEDAVGEVVVGPSDFLDELGVPERALAEVVENNKIPFVADDVMDDMQAARIHTDTPVFWRPGLRDAGIQQLMFGGFTAQGIERGQDGSSDYSGHSCISPTYVRIPACTTVVKPIVRWWVARGGGDGRPESGWLADRGDIMVKVVEIRWLCHTSCDVSFGDTWYVHTSPHLQVRTFLTVATVIQDEVRQSFDTCHYREVMRCSPGSPAAIWRAMADDEQPLS